ncbi:DUF2079 domain-containing protein [Sulfolobus acidocaldarius]|uniref:DUF2079 domain-containing protein n=1 Tax=Sulfolobus acidocaldarius TaxID=2285 RepID=UPI00234A6C5B|nr:DUF2079 domain-containing protein [Sulfolobus acidocaldarius]WCM35949.1 DUF2079 domain-containing protein [Sulfolobus acidocaldarius DSM 639]
MKLKFSLKGETLILLLAIIFFNVIVNFLFFIRLYDLLSGAFDLGLFMQEFYSTIYGGKIFYDTANFLSFGALSGLAIHPYLILFLVIPIYYLFPSWLTLSIIQTVVISISSIYLYRIANIVLGNNRNLRLPLILTILYLFNPLIISGLLFDFHAEALFPLFYMGAFYYYLRKEWKKFTLFIVFLILTMEAAYPIVIFFMIYLIMRNRRTKEENVKEGFSYDLATFIRKNKLFIIIIIVTLAVGLTIPKYFSTIFSVSPPTGYSSYYSSRISSLYLSGISLFWYDKINFLVILLASFGFLPIFAPTELLPGAPYILLILFSNHVPYFEIGWQYPLIGAGMFVVAMVYAISRLIKNYRIIIVSIFVMFMLSVALNPYLYDNFQPSNSSRIFSGGYNPKLSLSTALANYEVISIMTSLIPHNAVVIASSNLFPFVANDVNAYPIYGYFNTSYMITYLPNTPQYVLLSGQSNELTMLKGNYSIIAEGDNLILLKLNYTGKVVYFKPFSKFFGPNYLLTGVNTTNNIGRYEISSNRQVEILKIYNTSYNKTLWNGPYYNFAMGNYVAQFYLKLGNNSNTTLKVEVFDSTLNKVLNYSIIDSSQLGYGWSIISLPFSIKDYYSTIAFIGISLSINSTIYFGGVNVTQVSP